MLSMDNTYAKISDVIMRLNCVHVTGESMLPVPTMPWCNQEMELLPGLVRAQTRWCIVMLAVMGLSSSKPPCLPVTTKLAALHTHIHVPLLFISSLLKETQAGKPYHQDCAWWCCWSWISSAARIPTGSAERTSTLLCSLSYTPFCQKWINLHETRYEWEVEVYYIYFFKNPVAGYFYSSWHSATYWTVMNKPFDFCIYLG